MKKQEYRKQTQIWTRRAKGFKWTWTALLLAAIITVVISLQGPGSNTVMLTHIHGLGYSGDGQRILIPSHYGLKIYAQGEWTHGQGEEHDYMGFTAVDNGFYSSGHPAQGSNKKNPFGLLKSTDDGLSLDFLDLYGEIDFHLMSASYETHTIYVFNPEPNTRLETVGLYYTKDEAETWVKSEMIGINEVPGALAVHPTNDSILAIGTKNGLYVSEDAGNQFVKIADMQVTSLAFGAENELFVGSFNEKGEMYRMDIFLKQLTEVNLPDLTEDAITYISQNPMTRSELVFSTVKMNVYVSTDRGSNWKQIVSQGESV